MTIKITIKVTNILQTQPKSQAFIWMSSLQTGEVGKARFSRFFREVKLILLKLLPSYRLHQNVCKYSYQCFVYKWKIWGVNPNFLLSISYREISKNLSYFPEFKLDFFVEKTQQLALKTHRKHRNEKFQCQQSHMWMFSKISTSHTQCVKFSTWNDTHCFTVCYVFKK
jgi:hypothetical protein